MKKNLFVLILLCAMSVIQVNAGENPAVRREYDFTSFNAIRTVSDGQTVSGRGRFVSTNYKISLVKSDHYKVIMEVWDRDDIDLFEIRQTGNELAVSGSGTAVFNAEKFTVKDASLNLSGVSGASVTVTEKLETETSGNSHIDYYGRPKSVINKSSNVVRR